MDKLVDKIRQGPIDGYTIDERSRSDRRDRLRKWVDGQRRSTYSQRVNFDGNYNEDYRLTQLNNSWSVKAIMDCNREDESGIDIVKPMVTDSAHWISVVHASINIKGCRTSQECVKNKSLMNVLC